MADSGGIRLGRERPGQESDDRDTIPAAACPEDRLTTAVCRRDPYAQAIAWLRGEERERALLAWAELEGGRG